MIHKVEAQPDLKYKISVSLLCLPPHSLSTLQRYSRELDGNPPEYSTCYILFGSYGSCMLIMLHQIEAIRHT